MKVNPGNILNAVRLPGRRMGVLMLGTRSLSYALDGGNGGSAPVEFVFPEQASWSEPEQLGVAFREHLAQRRLRVRRVEVVVVPLDWTILRTAKFPPADDASLLDGMVTTAAEEAFAERFGALAYAYQVRAGADGLDVSIFGCPQEQLTRIRSFLTSAGLTGRRAVPAPAAAAQALQNGHAPSLVLLEDSLSLTLLMSVDGRCTWQRSVPAGVEADDQELSSSLRRAAMVLPAAEDAGLTIVGGRRALAAARGLTGRNGHLDRGTATTASIDAQTLLGAVSEHKDTLLSPTLNLLAGRTKDRQAWVKPAVRVGAPVAAVMLGLAIWMGANWVNARGTIARTRTRLDQIAPQVETAKRLRELDRALEAWHDPNPGYLDAKQALTSKFPDQGTIWLTGLELGTDGKVNLSGLAKTRSDVLDLLAEMEADEQFSQVTRQFIRPQGGRETSVAFAVTCLYLGGVK